MDVKFINPFLYGTIEVLKKTAFIEPRYGKAYLKKTSTAAGDVSGIIGVTGDAVGSLAISFSEACICDIVARMLGQKYDEADQEVFDAVGEITNMISGVSRAHMEKEGLSVYAAIPSVVYGKNHTIDHILGGPGIVIPFSTDHGAFYVDVCVKETAPEKMQADKYRVVNRITPVVAARATATSSPPHDADGQTDRKTVLKNKIKELTAMRDDMARQLAEKPFMEISRRQLFKKRIPFLDAQIRRLKLDISAIEMMAAISADDLDKPKATKHYQHYDDKKGKR